MSAPRTSIVFSRITLLVLVALVSHLATTDRSYPGVESLNDKVSHILAFGALSLAADFSFPQRPFGPAKMLALLGYGVLIEVVQYFLPYREASVFDVLADGVGIAAYALGFPLLKHLPVLRHLWSLRQQR
jgi:VanZ family protein